MEDAPRPSLKKVATTGERITFTDHGLTHSPIHLADETSPGASGLSMSVASL
jgi:hypothetical protein